MAIPFAFPSDDDTEASYQRLDQLLSDLYVVLQQILMTQRRIRDAQPSQIAHRSRNGQPSNSRPVLASASPPEPQTPPRVLNIDYTLQSASTSATVSDNSDLFRLGPSIAEVNDNRSPSRRRRRRRRRRTSSESSCCDETKNSAVEVATTVTTPDWTQVGVNLRKIADDFYASVGKEDAQVPVPGASVSDEVKRPCDPADASLLSMLVPPPFGGSLWTAVIFVVGWRLLARAR